MTTTQGLLSEAMARERAGDPASAYALFQQVLAAAPANLPGLDGAVRTAHRIGRPSAAIGHLRAALAAEPRLKGARQTLARTLLDIEDLPGAEQEAAALVAAAPRDADAINLHGVILKQQGRLAEAEERFRQAIRLDRRHASALVNLGNTMLLTRQYQEAISAFTQVTKLKPKDADALRRLGHAQHRAGRLQDALLTLNRTVMLNARAPMALFSRGSLLRDLGRHEEAMADAERGLTLAPENIDLLILRAILLRRTGATHDAVRRTRALLCLAPAKLEAWRLLGNLFGDDLGDSLRANAAYRRALTASPAASNVASRLCQSLMNNRHGDEGANIDEAHRLARSLIERHTVVLEDAGDLQGVFLRTADYEGLALLGAPEALQNHWVSRGDVAQLHLQIGRVRSPEDRHRLLALHRRWGDAVEQRISPVTRTGARRGSGKLRIGLLSSDLRNHPVGYFTMPLIERYDRDRYELYCYSFYPKPADHVQSLIAGKVDGFRVMTGASDAEAARRIADDGLDVLFELGGSTKFNRLPLMAHKPAPVQVSWLGYPHSAGLSRIDHILVDPYISPPDPALLIERPLPVAESWVCVSDGLFPAAPIEAHLPDERAGPITFGTMNNPYKYTPELFALWARVLLAVPGSRFLFVRPEGGSAAFRCNVQAHFARHGVTAERILFHAVRGKHLPWYNAIDIALDTAPQTGGTTTCEALWMGVPTVTLVGPAFFERLSHSNLNNAGLAALCARTPEDYVSIAAALVEDRATRRALRQGARDLIRAHPLGQAGRWVENFLAAAHRAAEGGAA